MFGRINIHHFCCLKSLSFQGELRIQFFETCITKNPPNFLGGGFNHFWRKSSRWMVFTRWVETTKKSKLCTLDSTHGYWIYYDGFGISVFLDFLLYQIVAILGGYPMCMRYMHEQDIMTNGVSWPTFILEGLSTGPSFHHLSNYLPKSSCILPSGFSGICWHLSFNFGHL